MIIHPVRMNGMMLGIPQTMSYFERMQSRITTFVTNNSRISAERFMKFMMEKDELVMDVGSVVDGPAAVAEGLIDELGGLSEAITCLYDLIEDWKKSKKDKEESEAAAKGSALPNPAEGSSGSEDARSQKEEVASSDTSHDSK
jgi:ClpP class serine protease